MFKRLVAAIAGLWAVSGAAQMPPPAPAPGLTFHEVMSPDGVPLNVVEAGNPSGPVLLFLHGAYQSYLSFIPQLRDPKLAERFRLIALDLRGSGGSGKPWDGAAYQGSKPFADDIRAVVSTLKLGKPLLVGWSYGGYISMDYIREYGPDAVRGVVLAGSHGGLLKRGPAIGPPPVGDLEALQAGAKQFMSVMSAEPSPQDAFDRGQAAYMMTPPYARKAMRGKRLDNTDLAAKGVGAPMLFILGTKDAGVPQEDVRKLVASLPLARLEPYEGVGHSAFVERTAKFNADVAAFSDAHPR
jgi:non-heme chloroperoxidase